VESALLALRPGSQWSIRDGDTSTLRWLDLTQARPTAQEIVTWIVQCRKDDGDRDALKTAARFTVKSSTTTAAQKVNALILIMDLDK
jgi:hypothetical protein